MARLRYDGLSATLGASLSDSATSATLTAALTYADGTAVPTLSGDDYFTFTILNPDGSLAEIVHVTGYTSAATTITEMTRGEEGTTAQAHANGALLRHTPTVRDVVGNVLIEDSGTYPPRADETIPALFFGATDPGPDGLDIALAFDGWEDISGIDNLAAHLADALGAHAASAIAFTPAGTISATDVQAAIEELDTEKAPLASPAFTGNPTAPTASPGDADTTIATTAFVAAAVVAGGGYTDENARDAIGAALVEGTGIDITISDGSDTITIAATGGGATLLDPIYTPLTGQTTVDEFSDASIDAAWVDCDPAGAPASARTWTEAGDAISVLHTGGDSANSIRGKVRPLSGVGGSMVAGDAFIARLTEFPVENGQVVGLVVSTAGTVAGVQLAAVAYNGGTALNHALYDFTAWASGGAHVNQALGSHMPTRFWTRIVYLGSNSWRQDLSGDGISWLKGTTAFTWANTPTHVGLASSSWGIKKSATSWDNLRRVAGVT